MKEQSFMILEEIMILFIEVRKRNLAEKRLRMCRDIKRLCTKLKLVIHLEKLLKFIKPEQVKFVDGMDFIMVNIFILNKD